ncbi:MAG TPA: amidohydrolase family protein [Opitutaceae bacterium]|nr:amidohydrolase family protein [Opitutaceae bacterium]
MKHLLRPLLISLVSGSTLLLALTARAETTAFVNVSVLPMDRDTVLTEQTVLVTGDRITAVGSRETVAVPDGARKIDGKGKFLMPGLGEMHGHNPAVGSSEAYVENIYFLFLSNGVTTVRSMLGWPGQLELRDKVNRSQILGPTLYLAGPSFAGNTVPSPAAAEARVREQKREGWDLLKVHPGLKRDTFDAMARTADELGIRFAGHIPIDVGLVHAIEKGQETVDHLDGYIEFLQAADGPIDPKKLNEIVRLTRETNTWVIPTMVLWETIIGSASLDEMMRFPELQYMPRSQVEQWKASYERRITHANYKKSTAMTTAENRKILLKALHEGGAKIIFGTDAPQQFSVPGFSIHREIESMASAGMSPFAILQTATRNVGEYLKSRDTFGLVAPGHRADLLLLQGNPLSDLNELSKRSGVMVRGQWIPESEIQAGLARIAAESKN